jgi:ABC-type glycerol-3-phosphate transport system permease component
MKTGFFQSLSGNQSSSRLIGFIVIIVSLVFAQQILYVGLHLTIPDLMGTATAAGVIFTTIAGPAMAFLFLQKKTEVKQEITKTEIP